MSEQTPGLSARLGALAILGGVLDQGAMVDETRLKGSGAERAEARGLADLTLRRLGQVDEIVAEFVPRMPSSPVNHILRLMAAELAFAGTAPHAAVDLAVRSAKVRRAGKMAGLINAAGRRIAEAGGEIAASQDAPVLNTPDWLGERMVADWGMETARAIASAHLSPAPIDLTLQPGRTLEGLEGSRLPTGSLRLAGRGQVTALPGFEAGDWWVQDAAAALPAQLIPEPRGKRVLDLCAAPGGKTLQLAAMGAEVTALDISESRLGRVRENLSRTGLSAKIVVADALKWAPEEPFDAILLDAPCSATGTIRRHPELPHRFLPKQLRELTRLQARLLERAFEWLTPSGCLVYCTCSLLKEEGEEQVEKFLQRHPALREDATLPGLEALFQQGQLRTRPDTWPERGHLDGFFAARLTRAP